MTWRAISARLYLEAVRETAEDDAAGPGPGPGPGPVAGLPLRLFTGKPINLNQASHQLEPISHQLAPSIPST